MPFVCREAFDEVCILATGDVVCSNQDVRGDRPLGNIKEQRIYDIFHGEKYRSLRKLLLESGDDTFCPHLNRNCYLKKFHPREINTDESTLAFNDKIQIESYSYCNLRCPSCLVSEWMKDKNHSRLATLPINCIRDVLEDTRKTLRGLWLFDYGEPFLDRRFLEILRLAKRINPRIRIYIHTNGTAIPKGWSETIVHEELLDGISFSIDGACQESYGKYRMGGQFDTAFTNMVNMASLRDTLRKPIPKVIWQYILFEWNDSDEEIQKVQELAKQHNLELLWVITNTEGKSKRYLADSPEYQKLRGIKHYSSTILAEKLSKKKNPKCIFWQFYSKLRNIM